MSRRFLFPPFVRASSVLTLLPARRAGRGRLRRELSQLRSSSSSTWAPASAAYYDGSIFFGGLRGEALYEAVIPKKEGEPWQLREHFKNRYGRIRDVAIDPDGFLYFTTRNRDGRGSAAAEDDRIVKVDPGSIREE